MGEEITSILNTNTEPGRFGKKQQQKQTAANSNNIYIYIHKLLHPKGT